MLIVAHAFGRLEGPLTSASEMARKTLTDVGVDMPQTLTRVAVAKVVRPPLEVRVELLNQLR